MDMITVTARTVDEAVTKALIELETTSDKLEYEVVDKGSTGFLGIGAKPAIIRAKKKESIEDKAMDFLSQIFEAMNMQVNITAAYNQEEQELSLNLEGEDMGILIGKRGQTLDSLQYLVSLIVNKGTEGYLRVKLDTENYRERRKETLETLAKNIAYKVKRTKRPRDVLARPLTLPSPPKSLESVLNISLYLPWKGTPTRNFSCSMLSKLQIKRRVSLFFLLFRRNMIMLSF